jgi:hypothetical protein
MAAAKQRSQHRAGCGRVVAGRGADDGARPKGRLTAGSTGRGSQRWQSES